MNFLRLTPVILACLLLAAHFYRAGFGPLAYVCAVLPLLLLLQRRWVPRVFEAVLVLGALEWLRTLYLLAAMRIAWGQPWGRLAAILGGVALLTAAAALVFRSGALKTRYGGGSGD